MIFKKLKEVLTRDPDELRIEFPDGEVAAAALLIEAAKVDGEFDKKEHKKLCQCLGEFFDLDNSQTTELMDVANVVQRGSVQLQRFTNTVKEHFDHDQRVELIEMLWEIVYADGVVDDYEANLLRRIGGLLYVPDRENGEARKRVMERLGLSD